MSNTLSADEVEARNIAAMGKALGEIYTVLANDLTMLTWKYSELAHLYGGTGERHDVMNRAAPFFFWLVQRTWWDDVLLGISRLVAPLKSAGRTNLTFQQLPGLVTDAALRDRVEPLITAVAARAEFAKAQRNKRIAHRDLDHALERAPQPLPPATLKDAESVLDELAEILNIIQRHYMRSETRYRDPLITHGIMELLYIVRDGLRREEIRQGRLDKGEYRPEDWDDNAPAL